MKIYRALLIIAVCILVVSCTNNTNLSSKKQVTHKTINTEISKHDAQEFTVLSEIILDADGKDAGLSAYDLIRRFGGKRPIESPDLYPGNHTEVKHILEDSDNIVGNHFVFLSHRDKDRDRNRFDITDRQRNEIKAYDRSIDELKGFENETMVYKWKFKINQDMQISKRFSHFFQLKAKGGNDKKPMITISGAKRRGVDVIEVRHNPDNNKGTILDSSSWQDVQGEWLSVYCRVTYADSGSIRLIAQRMSDDKIILDVEGSNLDLWRGASNRHFVRPKWGIYRSIVETKDLRAEEEIVRFANFRVSKVSPQKN